MQTLRAETAEPEEVLAVVPVPLLGAFSLDPALAEEFGAELRLESSELDEVLAARCCSL